MQQEKERNESRKNKSSRQEEKKKHICSYIDQTRVNVGKHQDVLLKCYDELVAVRLDHIAALIQFIFPVNEVQQ